MTDEQAAIIGASIESIRPLTENEKSGLAWDHARGSAYAVELDSGVTLVPSRDPEGNGPGVLLGSEPEDDFLGTFMLQPGEE
jgi:hypothetical protein